LLTITRDDVWEASEYHRVSWCQFLTKACLPTVDATGDRVLSDEPVYDGDGSTLLILTHDANVEVWDSRAVAAKFGIGPINYNDLMRKMDEVVAEGDDEADKYVGYTQVVGHEKPVIQAVFSADGCAIATASHDGYLRFFQVIFNKLVGKTIQDILLSTCSFTLWVELKALLVHERN
jgi:WD40 repeat protein